MIFRDKSSTNTSFTDKSELRATFLKQTVKFRAEIRNISVNRPRLLKPVRIKVDKRLRLQSRHLFYTSSLTADMTARTSSNNIATDIVASFVGGRDMTVCGRKELVALQ